MLTVYIITKCTTIEKRSLSKDKCALQPIDEDASEIACEGHPGNALHIPAEGDLLKAHDDHTGSRADDQHRAAHTGTVGQQLPEDAVDGQVTGSLHRIHTHATSHERYIVDNRREHTDDARHEVVIALEGGVERLPEHGQHSHFLKHGHGHEDAKEEHDGAEVDLRQQVAHALGHRVVLSRLVMEDLRDRPEHT